MNSQIINLFLPALILLIGAVLVLIMAAVPALLSYRNKIKWVAAVIVTLSFFGLLIQGESSVISWEMSVQSLRVVSIPTLVFKVNAPGRQLGMALTVITLSAILVNQRYNENKNESDTREPGWPFLLLSLSAALLTLIPANLFTLVLVWTLVDLISAVIRISVVKNPRDALVHWGAGAVGILFLWCTALLLQSNGSSLTLPITVLPSTWMGAALFLAVALRLSPFPFHLGLPVINGDRYIQPVYRVCLQFFPLAGGIWCLTQSQAWNVLPLFTYQFFSILLLTGLVVCGLLAWLSREYSRVTRWIIAAQASLIMLAALWIGPEAAVAEGITLLLGGGLLILNMGQENKALENRIAVGLGIVALAGFPLTWGGDGRFSLLNTWINQGQGLFVLVAGGSYLLLLGAAIKPIVYSDPTKTDTLNRVLVGAGFSLPAIGLLFRSGAVSQSHPAVWLAVLLPLGGGAFLAWGTHSLQLLQPEIEQWLDNVLALDWVRTFISRSCRITGQITHGIHQVLEGEGALLWVLAMLILGWLLLNIR